MSIVPVVLACSFVALASDIKQVDKTVPISPTGQVLIDTYKGRVQVTAWDQPTVEIHARIEPDGWMTDADAVRNTEVVIDAAPSSVRIKSDYRRAERSGFFNSTVLPLVNYTIRMPKSALLRIKDYKSDIDVSGMRAELDIYTYKGDTRLDGVNGPVRMNTYKGSVKAAYANYGGNSSFETYRGEIEIRLPADSRFDLETDLGRHASLNSDFPAPAMVRRGRTQARMVVNGSGPRMELKSYRGDFRLSKR